MSIGEHWLETMASRHRAGESAKSILRDYRLVHIDRIIEIVSDEAHILVKENENYMKQHPVKCSDWRHYRDLAEEDELVRDRILKRLEELKEER
jgi:hypothetical protein